MSQLLLSIVIPFFNEAERFKRTLPEILNFMTTQTFACELILVDDGSTDQSLETLTSILKPSSYTLLKNAQNEGKGSAVKQGMLAAHGDFVLFSDADLSTPLAEVLRFLPFLHKDYDIVIGSRALSDSRVEVHQNWLREAMGKTFNRLARLASFEGINDSQCGFKCFTKASAQRLFSKQQLKGFAFDAEILFLGQRLGYRILELPVMWVNDPHSRVNLIRDPVKMLLDLCKIRWLHRNTKQE